MALIDTLPLGRGTAPNRVMFGPIVTNLGDDERRLHRSPHRVLRAAGCGRLRGRSSPRRPPSIRSTGPTSGLRWPSAAGHGWADIADGLPRARSPGHRRAWTHRRPGLVGVQPARTVGTVAGCPRSTPARCRSGWRPTTSRRSWPGSAPPPGLAVDAGCDGVEINAGQHSLVRQFLSGLTNHRGDEWGPDRLLFARQVIAAVRAGRGPTASSACGCRVTSWRRGRGSRLSRPPRSPPR